MTHRLPIRTLLVALLGAILLAPVSVSLAQSTNPFQDIPVDGTFTDALGGAGTFEGTLDVQSFSAKRGTLEATGRLTGTATDSLGKTVGSVTNMVFTFVVNTQGTECPILHLDLGPIELDLLGLVVEISQIVIDITAEPGPGNLLGNLLCAIAGLLDPNNLDLLADLLNLLIDVFERGLV